MGKTEPVSLHSSHSFHQKRHVNATCNYNFRSVKEEIYDNTASFALVIPFYIWKCKMHFRSYRIYIKHHLILNDTEPTDSVQQYVRNKHHFCLTY